VEPQSVDCGMHDNKVQYMLKRAEYLPVLIICKIIPIDTYLIHFTSFF